MVLVLVVVVVVNRSVNIDEVKITMKDYFGKVDCFVVSKVNSSRLCQKWSVQRNRFYT